jgi:hypothetical protein
MKKIFLKKYFKNIRKLKIEKRARALERVPVSLLAQASLR